MSPETKNKPGMGAPDETMTAGGVTEPVSQSSEIRTNPMFQDDRDWAALHGNVDDGAGTQSDEDEDNPYRNRSADQSMWLGFLVAAVGAGAVGYLLTVP